MNVEHVVDQVEQMPCVVADLLELRARFGRQVGIFERHAVQPQNDVHGGAHFVADGCEEVGLRLIARLDRLELGLGLLAPYDALGDAFHKLVHDEHEDAAAEEYSADEQIGIAEQAHQHIADEEQHEQDGGNVEDAVALMQFGSFAFALFAVLDEAGESEEAIDVVDHEGCAKVHHAVGQYVEHSRLLEFSPKNRDADLVPII